MLLFTKTHEWLLEGDDNTVTIGISDFAQEELGQLVFVNLPEPGDQVSAGEAFADVESVKAVSDIMSPVSGTILEINEELLDAPEMINDAPYDAWFVKVGDITYHEDMLTEEEYKAFVEEEKA
ncbi:MAG: glycine cleavage system protein GcvH [Firmicutes bacterium]|nr:glycine cleavage system protein GcvH [Bacillota bacterium]